MIEWMSKLDEMACKCYGQNDLHSLEVAVIDDHFRVRDNYRLLL